MLEFYKQDKSIEEALDDEIVESIDMETVEGFGEEHGDPSLLLQYKTDTSKVRDTKISGTRSDRRIYEIFLEPLKSSQESFLLRGSTLLIRCTMIWYPEISMTKT